MSKKKMTSDVARDIKEIVEREMAAGTHGCMIRTLLCEILYPDVEKVQKYIAWYAAKWLKSNAAPTNPWDENRYERKPWEQDDTNLED